MNIRIDYQPRNFFVLFATCAMLLVACSRTEGKLKPLETGGESLRIFAAEPQLVTFGELQENPQDFKDSVIRVTGGYFRLQLPDCFPHNGYNAEWMLVSEDLRLDAVGFEREVRLISEETLLTVDGIFRLYEGPLGCGKAAPEATAWYLEVVQIVQPNPLVKSDDMRLAGGAPSQSMPIATPIAIETSPVQVEPVMTNTPARTIISTGTPTPSRTAESVLTSTTSPTRTRVPTGTPSITPTDDLAVTRTSTATPSPTPTPRTSMTPQPPTTSFPAPTQAPLPTSYPAPTNPPVPTSSYP